MPIATILFYLHLAHPPLSPFPPLPLSPSPPLLFTLQLEYSNSPSREGHPIETLSKKALTAKAQHQTGEDFG